MITMDRTMLVDNTESRPLFPYVMLALGTILIGAKLWVLASIAFAVYATLIATVFDKVREQNNLLRAELVSTKFSAKQARA